MTMRRRAVRSFVIAMLLAIASIARAETPPTIVVLARAKDERVARRLEAELLALGFDVLRRQERGADRTSLEGVAVDGVRGAVRIDDGAIALRVIDHASGAPIDLRVPLDASDADGSDAALRTVEIVRARLLDVPPLVPSAAPTIVFVPRGTDPGAPAGALVAPAEPTGIQAPLPIRIERARAPLELLMGASGIAPLRGLGSAADLRFGLGSRLYGTSFTFRLDGWLPIAPIDIPRGADGRAVAAFAMGSFAMGWQRQPNGSRFVPTIVAGASIATLGIEAVPVGGTTVAPFRKTSYAFVPYAEGRATLRVWEGLKVFGAALVGSGLPALRVHVDGAGPGTFAQPLLLGTAGIEVEIP